MSAILSQPQCVNPFMFVIMLEKHEIIFEFSIISQHWWYKQLKLFVMENKDLFILCKQYHCCWWPGGAWSQDISYHDSVPVIPEYYGLSIWLFNSIWLLIQIWHYFFPTLTHYGTKCYYKILHMPRQHHCHACAKICSHVITNSELNYSNRNPMIFCAMYEKSLVGWFHDVQFKGQGVEVYKWPKASAHSLAHFRGGCCQVTL